MRTAGSHSETIAVMKGVTAQGDAFSMPFFWEVLAYSAQFELQSVELPSL